MVVTLPRGDAREHARPAGRFALAAIGAGALAAMMLPRRAGRPRLSCSSRSRWRAPRRWRARAAAARPRRAARRARPGAGGLGRAARRRLGRLRGARRRARARLDRDERAAYVARDRARPGRRAAAVAAPAPCASPRAPPARSRGLGRSGRSRSAAGCCSPARCWRSSARCSPPATARSRRSPATSCPTTSSRSTTCPLRLLVLGLVASLAGGLAQAAAIADEPARAPLLRLGRVEWLLALGALNALFAAVRRRPARGALRRRRLRARDCRADVRRVRALGLRAARRGRRADARGRRGGAALGAHGRTRARRACCARCWPRCAADARRARLGAAPARALRGGVRVHPDARGHARACCCSAVRCSCSSSSRWRATGAAGSRRRRSCSARWRRSRSGSAIPTVGSPRTTSSATRRRGGSTRTTWRC